jgi:hypothetical protein
MEGDGKLAERIPARLTSREGRTFGFTVGLAFAVFSAIALWRGHPLTGKVLAGVSGALILAGAVIPTTLGPVQRGWMWFAHLLSRLTTPVFMGIVYFLIITPIALLMRAIGRRPLHRAEREGSFWVPTASGGRSDMERQF